MAPITQDAASATFSSCRRYRYTLTRIWDPARPILVFLMCNPSTADESDNDPTVERCQRRAVRMGYGGMIVLNLFALRSTHPSLLYEVDDPVGPDNDAAIWDVCSRASMVICAWGKPGRHLARAASVMDMLREIGVPLYALAINQDGSPKHPLYVKNAAEPMLYA